MKLRAMPCGLSVAILMAGVALAAGENVLPNGNFERIGEALEISRTLSIPNDAYALKFSTGLFSASGPFSMDDIKVEPFTGTERAKAEPDAAPSSAPSAGSRAPTLKLSEVGVEFNPTIVQQIQARRVKPEATPLTLLSIGPGAPGTNGAPKARPVKYPAHWTPKETPRELGGIEASPDVLLITLPKVLLEQKPEVVLLWGDAEGKRRTKPSERSDWEDVITVCLKMGAVPVMVLPNGQVSFSGGGGSVDLIQQPKKSDEEKQGEQAVNADMESLRRTMITVGGSRNIPMVEQAPFPTASERLGKILNLVEEHVLGRTPPAAKPDTKETGGKTKPDNETE